VDPDGVRTGDSLDFSEAERKDPDAGLAFGREMVPARAGVRVVEGRRQYLVSWTEPKPSAEGAELLRRMVNDWRQLRAPDVNGASRT
jgi:hypothetical protein